MITIYKYQLQMGSQTLALPAHAHLLCMQEQNHQLCLWAKVDTKSKDFEDQRLVVVGTGHPLPDEGNLIYIDTTQVGPFVWHLFERF